jgi:hypothetical protein
MIYWETRLTGNAPIQATGRYLGYYFYFTAKHSVCKIQFAVSKEAFMDNVIFKEYDKFVKYAGWISKRKAKWFIYKSCFKFLLNK